MSPPNPTPTARDIARSKHLSWLLRHGALEAGLPMDEAGWAPVEAVLAATGLSREGLRAAVLTNTKQRLQLEGDRIRCCQGHSRAGVPVTVEALEASWRPWEGEGRLWHGTFLDALPAIGREGLVPQARTHVHLTDRPDSAVGKRADVHVLIGLDPARLRAAGHPPFVAPNGVILCRRALPAAFVGFLTRTRRAEAARPAIAAWLGAPWLGPEPAAGFGPP